MIILDLNKVTINFGYGVLFENVSFSLNEGESISIVGPNGCGKSSLLKIINGEYKPDGGVVNIKKDAKIAYLDQLSSDTQDKRIVYDVLKDAFCDINQMANKIKYYEEILQDEHKKDVYDKILNSYCRLIEDFSLRGGYDIDVLIKTVCNGLKIDENKLSRNYLSLSGGEKTIIQLAKILLQKPDLILLDEPTNHLDIARIEWLENYIKSFKGACVIVSHDRYFLDRMSNKILDLSNKQAKVYCTNYSGYLKEKEKNFEKQMVLFQNQQLEIKRLEEQIKYFADMGMAKNSSTLCDRAHALQTQLDRILENKIEKPIKPKNIDLKFKEEKKSSKRVFEVCNLTVIAENKIIINDISHTMLSGERIALIGDNGSGKTTFIKTLIGECDLLSKGKIAIGDSIKIGYLPQIIIFKNEKMTVLEYFKDEIGKNEEVARRILASFNFYKSDVNKILKNLSGGEKIRLRLACLINQNVNFLIFDEPTNHIDIQTKEIMEKAIDEFSGSVLFVSHDRYFINKMAEKIIEFDNGNINIFYGNYDYYKNRKNVEK